MLLSIVFYCILFSGKGNGCSKHEEKIVVEKSENDYADFFV